MVDYKTTGSYKTTKTGCRLLDSYRKRGYIKNKGFYKKAVCKGDCTQCFHNYKKVYPLKKSGSSVNRQVNKRNLSYKKARNEGRSWFKNGLEYSYVYKGARRLGCKFRKNGRIVGYKSFSGGV